MGVVVACTEVRVGGESNWGCEINNVIPRYLLGKNYRITDKTKTTSRLL